MRYLFLLLGIVSLSLLPFTGVQAQEIPDDQCLCYCTGDKGATQDGLVADSGTCEQFCESESRSILQCYTSGQEELLPGNNNLCWTEADCVEEIVETHNGDTPSIWGEQERKCLQGRGYCYNPPGTLNPYTGRSATAQLGVQIGDLERPDDMAEYIGAIYRFLLPVGALLAVLMFMIAGLQWMTARGDASKLSAAKTRIGTATLGIVILLLAYTIAVLIDPNLVSFNVFRVPKVQSVIYLDGANSCENLQQRGAEILPDTGGCGDVASVVSLENVTAGNVIIGIEEKDQCTYSECASVYERCSSSGGTVTPECVRCNEVHSGALGGTSLFPSERQCGDLSLARDPDFAALDVNYYCEYVETQYFDGVSDFCAEIVYPTKTNGLDCDVLRQDYGENCRAYDFVQAHMNGSYNEIDDIEGTDGVFPLLDTVCSSDPCGFGGPGESCYVFSLDGPGYGFDEVFANCANTNSLYGFDDCVDKDGNEADCYLAKDGFDPVDILAIKEFLIKLIIHP
jgi:hypothetical protein